MSRNHADCVGNYCDAVLSGEIIAGRYVQLAVERHLDDLEHAHQRGLHFNTDIAEKSLRFVETACTHQKAGWAGQCGELYAPARGDRTNGIKRKGRR